MKKFREMLGFTILVIAGIAFIFYSIHLFNWFLDVIMHL